jgi:hypothetical protein
MKKFGVRAILSISAFCALLLLIPLTAYADSVTLVSINYGPMSGTGPGQGNVYPYGFTVNGSAGTIPLMCISYENLVGTNESWTAVITPIAGNTMYEEAAYIFSQVGTLGAVVTNWANWELFDPGDPLLESTLLTLSPTDQTEISTLLTNASAYVTANPDSSLYSDYVIYVPVDGTENPLSDGPPQYLIGDAPIPEPSSLILLGSGLLGLADLFYSKKRSSLKA